MRRDERFYKEFKAGSTELGGEREAFALSQGNRPLARLGRYILRSRSQEPSIIFGGAGSGKFANIGSYQLTDPSTQSFFCLDVGGQYLSTTWHHNLVRGRRAYAINAQGVGSFPDVNHPLDLFAILKNNDELFDMARAVAEMLITHTESTGDNAWVGQSARRWLTRAFTSIVLLKGRVTPKSLFAFIHAIDTDDDFLKSWGRQCKELPHAEYSTFAEIYRKKKSAEKEYGAIMGQIKSEIDWLSSEKVAEAISGDVNYLEDLGDPKKKIGVYFSVRGGTTKNMECFIRLVVGIAQLNCVNANKGALPLFYLEEAATMGPASFIPRAVSEFRKYFETVLVYQSPGQLVSNFGKAGAQQIMDSCSLQIYLGGGIRDIGSARDIADSVGQMTIEVDSPLEQADRGFNAENVAWQAFWQDVDMMSSARVYDHELRQSRQTKKIGRHAIDPAELMRLKDEILILAPGMGLQPVLAQKLLPYWENPAMAGRYGPDPTYSPEPYVTIKRKLFGSARRRFITHAVPKHLAHWPNHSDGTISYVEGYRTW